MRGKFVSMTVIAALSVGSFFLARARAQDEPEAADAASTVEVPDGAEAVVPGDTAQTDANDANFAAINGFLNNTTAANLKDKVAAFYAKDVRFEDPFGALDGREALLAYYAKLFEGITNVSFEIKEEFVSGDETVALWTMTLAHGGLAGGEPIVIDGVSQFRFAGTQVVYHRNYFDAGALVYEHVTFVGALVRWVKRHITMDAAAG